MIVGMEQPTGDSYKPDDAGLTLADLQFLRNEGGDLLKTARELAASGATDSLRDIQKLRERFGQKAVHAALVLAKASAKALAVKGKFHGVGEFFWSVPEALEQATSMTVARHKARRFAALSGLCAIADLCAGVGGDALGLVDAAPVICIERSFVRAWMAARNMESFSRRHPILVVQGDVAALPLENRAGMAFHMDPARRVAGKRVYGYADMVPGPEIIELLMKKFWAGAVKLGPGVDFESLPEGHLELISENGVNVQAVLWTGTLADGLGQGLRTASVLGKDGGTSSITGQPEMVAPLIAPLQYVYEIDAAVHHGGLAPALARAMNCHPINLDGGLVTSAELKTDAGATCFETIATIRYAEKLVPACLPGPCLVEVKPRGVDLDTDRLQRVWSKASVPVLSLLIYKAAAGVMATLCRRMA